MTRIEEIKAVRDLGNSIGYGNLMELASVLWEISLEANGGPTSGALVTTLQDDLGKEVDQDYIKEKLERRAARKAEVKEEITNHVDQFFEDLPRRLANIRRDRQVPGEEKK